MTMTQTFLGYNLVAVKSTQSSKLNYFFKTLSFTRFSWVCWRSIMDTCLKAPFFSLMSFQPKYTTAVPTCPSNSIKISYPRPAWGNRPVASRCASFACTVFSNRRKSTHTHTLPDLYLLKASRFGSTGPAFSHNNWQELVRELWDELVPSTWPQYPPCLLLLPSHVAHIHSFLYALDSTDSVYKL